MKFNIVLSRPLNSQCEGNIFATPTPFRKLSFWTFRGHDSWVKFARHSKDSLNLECLALAREPHAHLLLQNRMFSFGVMLVGAPAPLATVTFPMCQIQVRKSHSLTSICNTTNAILTISFSAIRVYILPFRNRCLPVAWSYGPFSSIWHGIVIIFDHARCCGISFFRFALANLPSPSTSHSHRRGVAQSENRIPTLGGVHFFVSTPPSVGMRFSCFPTLTAGIYNFEDVCASPGHSPATPPTSHREVQTAICWSTFCGIGPSPNKSGASGQPSFAYQTACCYFGTGPGPPTSVV